VGHVSRHPRSFSNSLGNLRAVKPGDDTVWLDATRILASTRFPRYLLHPDDLERHASSDSGWQTKPVLRFVNRYRHRNGGLSLRVLIVV